MEDFDTVIGFKTYAKRLIKQCKFKEAVNFANTRFESEAFVDL